MEEVDVEPGRALVDPWGAAIGCCLLAATLIVLVAGSAAGILGGVWEVSHCMRYFGLEGRLRAVRDEEIDRVAFFLFFPLP